MTNRRGSGRTSPRAPFRHRPPQPTGVPLKSLNNLRRDAHHDRVDGMTPDDRIFLRDFFRQVSDRPIGPDDPRYIPLYEDSELTGADPVELMARAIEWTPGQSVQLLSGYRGTGKSSELRRLEKRLRDDGYLVIRRDIEDYLNLSVPVDISDFLMAISGAFSDAIEDLGLPGEPPRFWDTLVHLLKRIEFNGISTTLGAEGGFSYNQGQPEERPFLQGALARIYGRPFGRAGGRCSRVFRTLRQNAQRVERR